LTSHLVDPGSFVAALRSRRGFFASLSLGTAFLAPLDHLANAKRKKKKKCKEPCPGDQICQRGRCVCPDDQQLLSGSCQACGEVFFDDGPPEQVAFVIQEDAGLQEVLIASSQNAELDNPTGFTVGTTLPFLVTFNKIDQTQPARVELEVTDGNNQVTSCDLTF
jgi:hypothetical protein